MDNEQYLNEVREALENDITRLGEVWQQLTNEGKSPAEIAEELGLKTLQFVHKNRRHIQAIIGDVLPEKPTPAKECKDALRGFIKRGQGYLSKETIQTLEKRIEECDRRASNRQDLEEEDAKVERETSQAIESGITGIYVYTYPHYYRHPFVQGKDGETDDRTYLKIGMSEKDAFKRVMQQKTGMPEPPMILQIWKVKDDSEIKEIEKKIHDHLRTVGHGENLSKRREWFLTNEQSVASTANLIGLKLHYERNPETDD